MGKKVKCLAIIIMLCVMLAIFSACMDEEVLHKPDNSYDPTLVLSGDIQEIQHYCPIDKSNPPKKDFILNISDLIDRVTLLGELKNIFILTHGQKCLEINAECIDYYYFLVGTDGIVRLYTNLSSHSQILQFPIISIAEVVFLTSNNSIGFERIYDEKIDIIPLEVMFRAFGLFQKIDNCIENDKYELTSINKRTALLRDLLGGREEMLVILKDGKTIKVDSSSNYKIHWVSGELYLTEKYKSPIKEFDFRSSSIDAVE